MAYRDFDKAVEAARDKWNDINADSMVAVLRDGNARVRFQDVFVVYYELDERFAYRLVVGHRDLEFGYSVGDFVEDDVVACVDGPGEDDWTEY